MLQRLTIRNFALISATEIDLSEGMNVVTGETGAGKSMIVDALMLVLGFRADSSMIRIGESKCVIEAHFSGIDLTESLDQELIENFELNSYPLILRREIISTGKSRAFINDIPAGLQALKTIGSCLVDLHGQHAEQQLFDPSGQALFLDRFAGCETLVQEFGKLRNRFLKVSSAIADTEEKIASSARTLEFNKFQLNEILSANPDPKEEERIENELKLLEHGAMASSILEQQVFGLSESEQSVDAKLRSLMKELGKISNLDSEIELEKQKLGEALQIVEDATVTFSRILERLEFNPEKLELLRERQDTYSKLKHKFSCRTAAELLEVANKLEIEVNASDSLSADLELLKEEFEKIRLTLFETGKKIEQIRQEHIPAFEQLAIALLKETGMSNAVLKISLEREETDKSSSDSIDKIKLFHNGINRISFLFSANTGVPAAPLSQIASGGEISRVMLVIKSLLAGKAGTPTLVFDEIDTGISGITALKVGKMMEKLAENYQVIAITHLPQIASRGKSHFEAEKYTQNDQTYSGLTQLNTDQRIHAIARMMSGDPPTEAALESARQLMM